MEQAPQDTTLKSQVEVEQEAPVEEEGAIPTELRFNEMDVPPVSEEQIAENERRYLDSIPLEPNVPQRTGSTQLAHMLNVSSFTSVTPEEIEADMASGAPRLEQANELGVRYEESLTLEADKRIVESPNVPVEQRVESLKRINNPLGNQLGKHYPVLFKQFAESLAYQEANRYGAGTYSAGGIDAFNNIQKAFEQSDKPTLSPVEWDEYVRLSRENYENNPVQPTDDKVKWEKLGMEAKTPQEIEAFIAGSAEYAEKSWKFWSSQGAMMFVPGSDQVYFHRVEEVMKRHGIKIPKTSAIDPDSMLGTAANYLGAGGWTLREYNAALKNADPATRKRVALDLLKLLDGKSGSDVYIAGMLTRMANGDPNVILDTFATFAPVAGAPGDLALGAVMLNKGSKALKAPVTVFLKKTPSATGDIMIRNAPQTSGDALEAAAAGNKVSQDLFDMDEAEAAFHVSPSATPFTDESWMGVKSVIPEVSKKAQRFIAEIDRVFGGYAGDLLRRSPDEIIQGISSHAKASGVAALAKGASKVIKTEGGYAYEAVYRAADGNGFDSLKEAREAAKAFGSKSETVTFAYEESSTGLKGVLRQPPAGMDKEMAKKWREAERALKSDLTLKWSIIRKGTVANDTPDELVFGVSGKNLVADPVTGKANWIHRLIDANATATPEMHAVLNKISGDHSRLNNLLEAVWTGRTGVFGNPKAKDIGFVSKLNRTEQDALSRGIRMAEEYENAGKILGRDPMIPLHQLETIPGWNKLTTEAFVEYVYNTKVMYYVANVNLRRQAIVDGFKRYVSASTGKAVNARPVTRAEFQQDLSMTGAGKKWAVGPDGSTTQIDTTTVIRNSGPDAEYKVVKLHQPFWHGKNWVTYQVLKADEIIEEPLPPFLLNARAIYSPRIHKGTHVVMGKTNTDEWVAIGMAENARFALEGKQALLKDPKFMEKFGSDEGRIAIREVRELKTADSRAIKMDDVDGQLHGVVYGARNDDLAYWGSDVNTTKGILDPLEALFETTNKLAVGKKDSEVSFRRLALTKAAQEEGLLNDNFVGVVIDDFSNFVDDPSKIQRVNQYKDAFKNLNAMVEINDKPRMMWSNGLNRMGQWLEQRALQQAGVLQYGLEQVAKGARKLAEINSTPFAVLQHWYTRLVISGKPLRQNLMQRASTLINVYRPVSFARGWWANSALDTVMSAMDEVLYRGDTAATKAQYKAAISGFASRIGRSEEEAEALARHWRDMGGYDAISNHLYAATKYKILQNVQGKASYLVNRLRRADDLIYGTQSRIGFENGERFAQRVAFMTEVMDDLAAGKASLKSKKYVEEAMARAADKTGNMRSEFRMTPGGGWLTLAAQFITYPTRMAFNTMPVVLGGSMRFTKAEKIKIIATQGALFGTVAYPIAEATQWAMESFLEGNLSEEEIAIYQKWSEPFKNGVFGEWAFNEMLEALTGEESNYDLSSTFGTTTGIDFVVDLMAGGMDGSVLDILMNTKLYEATRIHHALSISNMMFNRMFEGKLADDDMMTQAMLSETASILIPSLDAAWLSYIASSDNAMVSKAGTPTGEAFNAIKATLRYGFGIREADDALLYKAMEEARMLEGRGGREQQKTTAQKRADLIYKLIVNQVHVKRALGNSDAPSAEAMYNDIFSVYQSMIGYLPPDEIYDLREALIKKHEQAVARRDLRDHAEITLGQALLSSKAGVGTTQDVYEWAELRFPQEDMSPQAKALMEKAKHAITKVDGYNQAGEQ